MIRANGIEINNEFSSVQCGEHYCCFRSDIIFALTKHLILGFFNRSELFDLLYGHREDGGPELGGEHVSVLLSQQRHNWDRIGLKLEKIRGAHYWTRYRLVQKES